MPYLPITQKEFARLMEDFIPFERAPLFAVAVSGGADSLALLLLMDEWIKNVFPSGKVIGLTVDHRLRSGSAQEVKQLRDWLQHRGIEHHGLVWNSNKKITAIQQQARQARYGLLTQWCEQWKVLHLLTAHHAMDQIETFWMRLSKKSGVIGLSGMRAEISTSFGRLLRPLLGEHPERLKETLKRFNQSFITDPSNINNQFTRVRWRRLQPLLEQEGLEGPTILAVMKGLQAARALIEKSIDEALAKTVVVESTGCLCINHSEFNRLLPLVAQQVLGRVLQCIGGGDYAPKQRKLSFVQMQLYLGTSFKGVTLAGCSIIKRGNDIWITRELRAIRNKVAITGSGCYRWDNRFVIQIDGRELPATIMLRCLGMEGLQALKKQGILVKKHRLPVPVLRGLPSLWVEDHLWVAPFFNFYNKAAEKLTVDAQFVPRHTLTV